MEFYLDDCADANDLTFLLRQAGYAVRTPRTEQTRGVDDAVHLEYAAARGLTLVTKNPKDFRDLHQEWQAQGRSHYGILLIFLSCTERHALVYACAAFGCLRSEEVAGRGQSISLAFNRLCSHLSLIGGIIKTYVNPWRRQPSGEGSVPRSSPYRLPPPGK
jgi:Domain of unknown function (DUF5615)